MVNYISKPSIVKINKIITDKYSQPHAVVAEANLEHYLSGMERYCNNVQPDDEELLRKAAYLLYHLAFDAHVFSDGNKRTAIISTLYFLLENSVKVSMGTGKKQEELASFIKDAAAGRKSLNATYVWLSKSTEKPGRTDLDGKNNKRA